MGGRGRKIVVQGWSQAKVKPYLKNKLNQKGLGMRFKCQNACLARVKPRVQTQVPSKAKKKKKIGRKYKKKQESTKCHFKSPVHITTDITMAKVRLTFGLVKWLKL
jgi:hypothetical protein